MKLSQTERRRRRIARRGEAEKRLLKRQKAMDDAELMWEEEYEPELFNGPNFFFCLAGLVSSFFFFATQTELFLVVASFCALFYLGGHIVVAIFNARLKALAKEKFKIKEPRRYNLLFKEGRV